MYQVFTCYALPPVVDSLATRALYALRNGSEHGQHSHHTVLASAQPRIGTSATDRRHSRSNQATGGVENTVYIPRSIHQGSSGFHNDQYRQDVAQRMQAAFTSGDEDVVRSTLAQIKAELQADCGWMCNQNRSG